MKSIRKDASMALLLSRDNIVFASATAGNKRMNELQFKNYFPKQRSSLFRSPSNTSMRSRDKLDNTMGKYEMLLDSYPRNKIVRKQGKKGRFMHYH